MNLGMISNYVKAKWSKGLTDKKVDVTTKDIRLLSCFGNGDDIPVCPALRASDRKMGKFYCGECGCGDKATTWLNGTEKEYTKLDHPYLSCPRRMPGFSDYEPANKISEDFAEKRKMVIELTLGADVLSNKNLIRPEMSDAENETERMKNQKNTEENLAKQATGGGCPSCEVKAKVRDEVVEWLRINEGREPDFKNEEYAQRFKEIWGKDPRVIDANQKIAAKHQGGVEEKEGCSSCGAKKKLREEITKKLSGTYEGKELTKQVNEEFQRRLRESRSKSS
jgi:hypothetical protein